VRSDLLDRVRLEVDRADALVGFGERRRDDRGVLRLVPDPGTRRAVAWDEHLELVLADLVEPSGAVSPLCTRSLLKRILDDAARAGYEISTGVELEFFLVDPATRTPVYAGIESYSLGRVEYEPLITAIRNDLAAMHVPVGGSHPEYAGGQFEVNLVHARGIDAADNATLLRHCVRAIARRFGLDCTFLAKPWNGRAGNGMHVHQSLWRNGVNVFLDVDGLSPTGNAYLAGLLERMREFALLGSSTPNAYHRRGDLSFAPTGVCWGADNRTVGVRTVVADPNSTRIEQRDACADANVYLTLAGQYQAGLDGVRRSLRPPPRAEGNAYLQDWPRLPTSFEEAYKLLVSSDAARRLLGVGTVTAYLAALAPELEIAVISASDWERQRYAEIPL
jgi:glutamine synthetase